jgi:2-iminobutanoate/2-iminopropanoate deaminase
MKRTVTAERGVKPAGPYSHATVANGFVFVSGQGPFDPETNSAPDAGHRSSVRSSFHS